MMKLKELVLIIVCFLIISCTTSRNEKALPKLERKTNSIGIKLVKLPEGTFKMGHPQFRKPVHKVHLTSFWMSETEVTNAQYESLIPTFKRTKESKEDNSPAVGISKSEALAFARLLSKKEGRDYRLPTDAQWEYAARGGLAGKDHPWGDKFSEDLANSGVSGNAKSIKPVATYPANAFGLYDMVGNACEWILDNSIDFPSEVSKKVETNPVYMHPDNLWVARGGSAFDWYPFVWSVGPYAPVPDREVLQGCGIRLVLVD